MAKQIVIEPVFMSIDIETAGINKSIFAIGCVLFKRLLPDGNNVSVDLIEIIEEKIFAFTPKKPSKIEQTNDMEQGEIETMIYNDFSIDTWDNFWSKYEDILEILSTKSNCNNEMDMLKTFYDYWTRTTTKYHNIKLVSDNVAFDIGYIDHRIALLNDKIDENTQIKNRRPLNYQYRKKKWYYVTPLDTNTLECVIKLGENGKKLLDTMIDECPYENNHDPISDCKRISWIFARIMAYLTL